jgi:tetratricopeptide (TPR) repeat protein
MKHITAIFFLLMMMTLTTFSLAFPPSAFAQTQTAVSLAANAENAPHWYKLERGKQLFRSGRYGEALTLFEDARNDRSRLYEDYRAAVLSLLSHPEVRALHDDPDQIIAFAEEQAYNLAASAFAELFFRVSKEELGGKASASLDIFDRLKEYPEAEFWIGEVYRVEGAVPIAIKQYERALAMSGVSSDPALETEIRFKLAAFQKMNGNYNEMERRLTEILDQDTLWSEDASRFVKNAMQRTLENEGVDQFLVMYRYTNAVTEKAHRLLAAYFYQSGRHLRAAEHYLFAWMIASSTVIEAYQSQLIRDFKFTSLSAITGDLARRPDITSYMNEVEYYKNTYYLGASLYGAGKESAARSVWAYLSAEENSGEWRARSQRQLRDPQIEPPVPLP